ncbi:hypothetical protein FFF34_018105 [Inquilinus sp. KBS0705]|nr:hypothetical protein FFF34_018105 [Inquilinus sp. KBS0705]
MLKAFLTVFLLSFAAITLAQTPDSLKKDTVITKKVNPAPVTMPKTFAPPAKKEKQYHPDSTHIPSLAVKRSLMIPGWGQVYNRKYWKVPLVYAGLGSLAWVIVYNQQYYKEFLALARIVKTGNVPVKGGLYYNDYIKYKAEYEKYNGVGYQALADASDGYLRNRTLGMLGVIGFWGIQAIDAYIDAKFINAYTVDDNLSFKVTPGLIGQPMYAANFSSAFIPAIKITFTL